MSHPPAGHGHDAHPPEKPPRVYKHGPSDCYGMPQKKFWRIVFGVGFLTAAIVVSTVILVNR